MGLLELRGGHGVKEAGVLFLVSKGLWAKDLVFPCLSKVEQKNHVCRCPNKETMLAQILVQIGISKI